LCFLILRQWTLLGCVLHLFSFWVMLVVPSCLQYHYSGQLPIVSIACLHSQRLWAICYYLRCLQLWLFIVWSSLHEALVPSFLLNINEASLEAIFKLRLFIGLPKCWFLQLWCWLLYLHTAIRVCLDSLIKCQLIHVEELGLLFSGFENKMIWMLLFLLEIDVCYRHLF